MDFEMTHEGDLGAPLLDVVQEAIDATATTYTRTPEADVEETLRQNLHGRGVRATDDAVVTRIAAAIRSGHGVELGAHDGSVQ